MNIDIKKVKEKFKQYPFGYMLELSKKRILYLAKGCTTQGYKPRVCCICNKKIPRTSYALKFRKRGKWNGTITSTIICAICLSEISKVVNTKQHIDEIPNMIAEQM